VNIKLTIEYDGTNYHGWQIQPNGNTIQAVLERAIATFLGTQTRIIGSGRTDAGVHALGQTANFFCAKEVDLYRLQRGLNALTPQDIVIRRVEVMGTAFDARRHARSRIYEYRIWNSPWPSPFHSRYAWHVHDPLEVGAMQNAIAYLEGEHDFTSFQAAACDAAHAVRRVDRNLLESRGSLLVYTIEATAFLRHMVRNVIGSLVEVGRGERPPQSFSELLEVRDRTQAGPTAPPHGLFLVEVRY
jgi:tRNA pseudouridine38-40 synthase